MKNVFVLLMLAMMFSGQARAVSSCIYGRVIKDNKVQSYYWSKYNPSISYDNKFRRGSCKQSSINKYWKDFGMEKKYWDDGMGYYSTCDAYKPLNRMFNAIRVLHISKNSSQSSNAMLNHAYGYSKGSIKHLRVKCGTNDRTNASMSNRIVKFYWKGIYNKVVVERALTLLHEARHRHKGHNGGKKCPCKCSCDSKWSYNGSNTYGALYGWWYGYYAKNSNTVLKNIALNDAQWNIDNRFVKHPGYRVR